MTKTKQTNEAFAALAYRRSIIQEVMVYLTRKYIGSDGQDPKDHIVCEEVAHIDSAVPTEEIAEFVDELKDHEHELRLDMGKFELVRRTDVKAGPQWKKEKPKGQGKGQNGGQ
jgi:hypothetical protein